MCFSMWPHGPCAVLRVLCAVHVLYAPARDGVAAVSASDPLRAPTTRTRTRTRPTTTHNDLPPSLASRPDGEPRVNVRYTGHNEREENMWVFRDEGLEFLLAQVASQEEGDGR